MVKDAEIHAEEDKKFAELISIRNNADAIIHAAEKNLKNIGDKITASDRGKVELAINELKNAVKIDDKSVIEAKINQLNNISTEILSNVNKKNANANNSQKNDSTKSRPNSDAKNNGSKKQNDDVVDAEFEEVKDDKK